MNASSPTSLTRVAYAASRGYLALLVALGAALGVTALSFQLTRPSPGELTLGQAVQVIHGLKPSVVLGAAALGLAGAGLGVLLLRALARQRTWALAATGAVAAVVVAGLYLFTYALHAVERGFYARSWYVRTYLKLAYPLGAVSTLILLLVIAAGVLALARRRAGADAGTRG